jgi:hypothetical protein
MMIRLSNLFVSLFLSICRFVLFSFIEVENASCVKSVILAVPEPVTLVTLSTGLTADRL